MPRKADIPGRVFKATMALAADRGWRHFGMREIAGGAKLSLAELHDYFSSRGAILAGLAQRIDRQVLDGAGEIDAEEASRDRLFGLLMARFDALAPFKAGLASVCRAGCRDPLQILCGTLRLERSMAWMLEAAGIGAVGCRGRLRAKGLAAVWLATFRAWLADESDDMASTMAALDRNLRRAEAAEMTLARAPKLGAWFRRRGGVGEAADAAA